MPNALVRVKKRLEELGVSGELLAELEADYAELVHKADHLELLLITLVRTGWPWDEEGAPNALHAAALNGYGEAMLAAKALLGLGLNTRITRTEPKT